MLGLKLSSPDLILECHSESSGKSDSIMLVSSVPDCERPGFFILAT